MAQMAALVSRTFPGGGLPTDVLRRSQEDVVRNAELAAWVVQFEADRAEGSGEFRRFSSLKKEIMEKRRRHGISRATRK